MSEGKKKEQKIFLWIMMVSSFTGIMIWYIQGLSANPISDWGRVTITSFSFFTNLTNAIIVIMAVTLLFGRGRLYNWFKKPSVQSAWCLYIAYVGLGFWLLLGGPQNVQTVVDFIPQATAHTLSPLLGAIYFIRIVPKESLTWRHPFLWLIYPISYLVYWLFRGPVVGYYPYFFLDVNRFGYDGVFLWSLALMGSYILLGFLMLGIGRLQSRKSKQMEIAASQT